MIRIGRIVVRELIVIGSVNLRPAFAHACFVLAERGRNDTIDAFSDIYAELITLNRTLMTEMARKRVEPHP